MKKYNAFTLNDVENLLQLKTWWAIFGALPVANRIVVVCTNYTKISPNSITGISMIFRLLSGFCFLKAGYFNCVAGSLFYYFAYVLDCVDGPVARLTGQTSELGRYLDHLSDLFGDIFILCCLAYGQNLLFSIITLSMCFMHLAESYFSYLAGFAINNETGGILAESKNTIVENYNNYRQFFFDKNLKSFFSFPDYEFLVFIFFPIIGIPKIGLIFGFFFLLTIVLYTILSTFWAIHSNDIDFP